MQIFPRFTYHIYTKKHHHHLTIDQAIICVNIIIKKKRKRNNHSIKVVICLSPKSQSINMKQNNKTYHERFVERSIIKRKEA
jgi:hypothetical protein